ncbi:cyclase family protein [Saccharopolyspora sp. NPDC047091]|uniref:cyclase family protein n=1 Tax=Saccharopolyspora sp. NPDC047091 TaxID=3155924 RepID=UPI00340C35D3
MTAADPDVPTNRGRWGADDELGTLNHITDQVRARAVAEARLGRVVSLAQPLHPVPLSGGGPLAHTPVPMPAPVQQVVSLHGSPAIAVTDVLVINTHSATMTHLDALGHVPVDGEIYPGVPVGEAVAGGTLRHGSTTAFADGIVTRGVLLDLAPGDRLDAGHAVTADDLDAAERRSGAHLDSGDALIVRGGWMVGAHPQDELPHLTADAVRWMAEREVSLYGGDIGDRVGVPGGLALHEIGLARLGMPLVDAVQVDGLAATCAELGRTAFLLTIGPIPVHGATGVPVNPLAIF